MRWVDIDRGPSGILDPATKNATAGEDNSMGTIVIEHGQFQVVIKGCGIVHNGQNNSVDRLQR